MAVQDTEWAYSLNLAAPQKAVLLALAYRRNGKTGKCFPSQKDIQEMTGLSEATVRRSLGVLSEANIITRTPNIKGRYRTNDDYTLNRDYQSEQPPVTVTAGQPDHQSERRSPPVTVTLTTGHSDGAVVPTGIQPEVNRNKDIAIVETSSSFDEFYAIWPKKRDRPKAMRAWTNATRTTPGSTILAVAQQYADNPHRPTLQFVPYPATWLNRLGWTEALDGPPEIQRRATSNDQSMSYLQELALRENQPKGIAS